MTKTAAFAQKKITLMLYYPQQKKISDFFKKR
jgi:hypothetical protein